MKLDKAIETVQNTPYIVVASELEGFDKAVKLLIEAGKRIKACREPEGGSPSPLLKSETEE